MAGLTCVCVCVCVCVCERERDCMIVFTVKDMYLSPLLRQLNFQCVLELKRYS
jgi:hypothetical protein